MSEFIGQPIMENSNLCIFNTEDGYDLYKRGEGLIDSFDKEQIDEMGNAFWFRLLNDGWKFVPMYIDIDED